MIVAGWALFFAAFVSAALIWLRPAWFEFGVFTNLAAFVVPSLVATVVAFLYVRER